MTEKPEPTPGPWELAAEGTYPADEGHKILGPWRKTKAGHDTRSYVAQFMTKADAKLILRAQHMDKLVDLIKQISVFRVEEDNEFIWISVCGVVIGRVSNDNPRCIALIKFDAEQRAMLANIDGKTVQPD